MRRPITFTAHLVCWASLCAVLFMTGLGCQNPRSEARKAVRSGRWGQYLAKFAKLEADRPERLEALRILHEEYEAERSRRLEKMLKRIEADRRKKNQDWAQQEPLRREQLDALLKGHPENIPRTWDHMVK